MTARLFSKTGKTLGLGLELEAGREAFIGRDPASDLAIEQPLMSSRHARIFYDADAERYALEDLGSLNGTELDGDRVIGTEALGHLNVITFAGSYDFFFFDPERCAQRHPAPPPARAGDGALVPGAPAAAEPPDSAAPADDEVTLVEKEQVAMPSFLARRADAISDAAESANGEAAGPEATLDPAEVTSLDLEPVALPGVLARRADQARADDTSTAESPPDDDRRPNVENTLREKLPVALPDILARRADQAAEGGDKRPDVQHHETVDLAEIEELIASEGLTEAGERQANLAEGLQLIITESGGQVRRFPLVEGKNLVGRGAGADVTLKYPDLSRSHARITVAGETVTLRDLGSRNRTFVDDRPVDPQVDVEIELGARLRFGSVEARLTKAGGQT